MAAEEETSKELEAGESLFDLENIKEQMRWRFAVEGLAWNWWAVLLRGVTGIVFGHVTIVAPIISLAALAPMFGVYALADGALAMMSALRRNGSCRAWWPFVLVGIVGIGTGLTALVRPAVMEEFALGELIAPWALVTGVLGVIAAVRLRKVIVGEWLLALSGAVSFALGALLALFPNAAELAVILGIGAYAFVVGVLLIALGLRLRSRRLQAPAPPAAPPEQAWADL
ncbi:MAG: HdeD family acid-resistance protein [Candidatus Binatia bacterium]